MQLFTIIFFGSMLVATLPTSAAYDINCLYPENMPDPFTAWRTMSELNIALSDELKFETPVVVYVAKILGMCNANCLAYHDNKVLNVITKARPLITVPSFGHNSFSRVMCMIQCHVTLAEFLGVNLERGYEGWGLDVRELDLELFTAAQQQDLLAIFRLLVENDYHPFIMGQLVALEIAQTIADNGDGWNAQGLFTYDHETDSVVRCTSNCEQFSDTTGYFPRNHPRKLSFGEDKYNISGTDVFWQPLAESGGFGYNSRQQHVVPHIGKTVSPLLPRPFGEIPPPNYNYSKEALLVVERMRETANSEYRKKMIRFYDNKLYVRGLIQESMKVQFEDSYSFEEAILFVHGLDLGEHDAIVNSWKEKVRYDIVRPTTVIQRWGSDLIDTYNGDPKSTTSVKIKARDFQAFIRVMPHSEYPSGSGCLCISYGQFTTAFTRGTGRNPLVNLTAGPDAGHLGCPGDKFPVDGTPLGCTEEDSFVLPDMATLINECGESRLWGGMHFTASVLASSLLCDGLGDLAFETIEQIRNGRNFTSGYIKGDPLPEKSACSLETQNSDPPNGLGPPGDASSEP